MRTSVTISILILFSFLNATASEPKKFKLTAEQRTEILRRANQAHDKTSKKFTAQRFVEDFFRIIKDEPLEMAKQRIAATLHLLNTTTDNGGPYSKYQGHLGFAVGELFKTERFKDQKY